MYGANFQRPFRRTTHGIGTLDLELDMWVPGDGSPYRWKDVEHFEARAASGGFAEGEAERVREESRSLAAALERGEAWWDTGWAHWQPDDGWGLPDAVPYPLAASVCPIAAASPTVRGSALLRLRGSSADVPAPGTGARSSLPRLAFVAASPAPAYDGGQRAGYPTRPSERFLMCPMSTPHHLRPGGRPPPVSRRPARTPGSGFSPSRHARVSHPRPVPHGTPP
ncbi:hypothetical protein GCM10010507_53300 [Streptomyces cinnamoneus]|uniref:DUF402 domain-containing protein n=1 Tax=Streptomyces cinnamoneus TaxID=53446 RepID=A0A918U0N1_STRCJ|nr:hypothetical protein GCM10010507_53300 [Streptomyces cinnamoneus]